VTRKLAIKAGFVFALTATKLPQLLLTRQLVSDYNFDTVFTLQTVLFKLNNLFVFQNSFSSPSESSDFIGGPCRDRTDDLKLAKLPLSQLS
jgi:hypothetical protein